MGPLSEWFALHAERYRADHRHPVNRLLHAVGIPAILAGLALLWVSWVWGLLLAGAGGALLLVGHVAFEGNLPSLTRNPVYPVVALWLGARAAGRLLTRSRTRLPESAEQTSA